MGSPAHILEDVRVTLGRVREEFGARADQLEHLVEGTELKLGLREDPGTLAGLDLPTRLQHGLRIVNGEVTQSDAALAFVGSAVDEALALGEPLTHPIVGLALWCGRSRQASGFDTLAGPYKVMAVERCLGGGVPADLSDAIAFVDDMLPRGASTDTARLTLFRGRFQRHAPATDTWLDLASGITFAAARAQLLLECAAQQTDAGPAEARLVAMAQELIDASDPDEQSWRGQIEVLCGGVIARADEDRAGRLVEPGWAALAAITDASIFQQAWTALLLAESQRGLEPWRRAVDRIGSDRTVKSRGLMADLAYDAAGLVRWVRGTPDERSAALSPVSDLLTRLNDAGRQTAGWAAFAEASNGAVGRTAASALTRVEKAEAAITQSGERLQILPRVARLCGQADLPGARALVARCFSDTEQVVAGLALAEVAAGIRR